MSGSTIDKQLFSAFTQRAWPRVLQCAAQLLPLAASDAGVHFMAGVAHMELQQAPQALDCLRKATQLEPRRVDFATQYARALAQMRRMREARSAADHAMALAPDHPSLFDTLGVVYSQANVFDQAVAAFQRAVALQPNFPPYRFKLAYSLIAVGDAAAAERELEACVALEPRYWEAHLSLAQLRRQTMQANHVARLQALLAQHGRLAQAQVYLHLALAKEFEDIADYSCAFSHYTQGKAALRAARPYAIQRDQAVFDNLMRAFPDVENADPCGDPSDEPIFVIGMPRSGTTVLDRVLSSHPDVHSAGEMQNFATALQNASGRPAPLLLDADLRGRVRDINWKQLGADYLASTRPATTAAPRFIDKLPHNFLYAGFIARALPRAKIICLRRDPLDTCLGNFRHLFEQLSSYYDYASNLLDTGRYYVMFDRLMEHWQRVLPGRILEVQYEDLVQTQAATTRRLLAFCDLPWNDACLHPEANSSPVNTPNAWQVRTPIYPTAIKRWKHYQPQLGELRALLDSAGIAHTE